MGQNNPFQMPRASAKHAGHQVNGETEPRLTQQIIKTDVWHKQK
ncbi:YpzG family protein [Sporolactobacillus sp. THM7-4]|nr:YpzG family protein [Sporolactobacillus sp. THM7-4]